jgi:uncharacterized protein
MINDQRDGRLNVPMPLVEDQGNRRRRLKFRRLSVAYAIVRLEPGALVPDWSTKGEFSSITRSAEELSIVCPFENLPAHVHSSHRWICLKLEGPFAFSQTGVLLSFIEPLSSGGIPIFAISTYDTDYVLIQEESAEGAIRFCSKPGTNFRRHDSRHS